jgi:hypothetical protein
MPACKTSRRVTPPHVEVLPLPVNVSIANPFATTLQEERSADDAKSVSELMATAGESKITDPSNTHPGDRVETLANFTQVEDSSPGHAHTRNLSAFLGIICACATQICFNEGSTRSSTAA